MRNAIAVAGWLMPGEIRVFEPGELEQAKAWTAGGTDRSRPVSSFSSSRVYRVRRRTVPAGSFSSPVPSRHARAGRIGRALNPPPQLGQTSWSTASTHAAQKVHS